MLNCVVLPEMSTVSAEKYLGMLSDSDPVTMIRDSKRQHGLFGQKGNHNKDKSQEFFKLFADRNSSQNGRTADKNSCFHGKSKVFDAKYTMVLNRYHSDGLLALCNDTLKLYAKLLILSKIRLLWFRS